MDNDWRVTNQAIIDEMCKGATEKPERLGFLFVSLLWKVCIELSLDRNELLAALSCLMGQLVVKMHSFWRAQLGLIHTETNLHLIL